MRKFPAQMVDDGPAKDVAGDGVRLLLDLMFGAVALRVLRAEVLVLARQAGLPDERAREVVLAVHELAANVICHGGGKGRLRVWQSAGALHCQVDDGDLIVSADPPASLHPFPELLGHGLWIARRAANQMRALSGPYGARVTLVFKLPAAQ
jgi:anti-sigma regulatory factor (Ser/Thr protein kinase)